MRRMGHVEFKRDRRGVYRVLVEKPVGMRPLGRPRRRWEDIIKMHVVADDPGSKPDQKYARRRDKQNYMGRIK